MSMTILQLLTQILFQTGFLSGLGHVLRTTWSYISALLGDYLLRTNKMSRTNVRKLATAGCKLNVKNRSNFKLVSGLHETRSIYVGRKTDVVVRGGLWFKNLVVQSVRFKMEGNKILKPSLLKFLYEEL